MGLLDERFLGRSIGAEPSALEDNVSTTCAGVTSEVDPGATATATYAVRNDNSVEVVFDVVVLVDGSVAATDTLTLTAGESDSGLTIDFTAPSSDGDYDIDTEARNVEEVPSGF